MCFSCWWYFQATASEYQQDEMSLILHVQNIIRAGSPNENYYLSWSQYACAVIPLHVTAMWGLNPHFALPEQACSSSISWFSERGAKDHCQRKVCFIQGWADSFGSPAQQKIISSGPHQRRDEAKVDRDLSIQRYHNDRSILISSCPDNSLAWRVFFICNWCCIVYGDGGEGESSIVCMSLSADYSISTNID